MNANFDVDKSQLRMRWVSYFGSLVLALASARFLYNIDANAKSGIHLANELLIELKAVREDMKVTQGNIHLHDLRISALEQERRYQERK